MAHTRLDVRMCGVAVLLRREGCVKRYTYGTYIFSRRDARTERAIKSKGRGRSGPAYRPLSLSQKRLQTFSRNLSGANCREERTSQTALGSHVPVV